MAAESSFPKSARLRKRAEYLAVQQHGRKAQTDHFLVLVVAHPGEPRLGVTVSSKVGNAVVRNRVKRWIREYVRRHKTELPQGDMVLIAKTSAATVDHAAVDRDVERLLARARKLA